MRSSSIPTILHSIAEADGAVRVFGAPPGAQALTLAKWSLDCSQPIICICPDEESAQRIGSDVEVLSEILLNRRVRVSILKTWDQSPYSPIAPSLKTRISRIQTLSSLLEKGTLFDLYLVTLESSCQTTVPKKFLSESLVSIEENESVGSREALIRQLIDVGYMRVDPVEDPGTFAVRGDIIDLFPINEEQPIRIELFDDLVERVRFFDPTTQRTSTNAQKVEKLTVPPAREVVINDRTHPILRAKIKSYADDAGIRRQVRDPILESVQTGIYPDHSDAWAPFCFEHLSTFWSYVSDTWPVVWSDRISCEQNFDEFVDKQKNLSGEATDSGLIIPLVQDLFQRDPTVEKQVESQTKLCFDALEFADTSTLQDSEEDSGGQPAPNRHRIEARENDDLQKNEKNNLSDLEQKFQLWKKQGFKTYILTGTDSQADRIEYLLRERQIETLKNKNPNNGEITVFTGKLSVGFRWPAEGIVLLTDDDVLGTKHSRKTTRASTSKAKDWSGLQNLTDLAVGDLVVHIDHGIGRYVGISRLNLLGAPSDFLQLEYANKDKLYLPVYRLNLIQKYMGGKEGAAISRLGGQQFEKAKQKVKDAVKKLAFDLVDLYAKRQLQEGWRISPRDSNFKEFEGRFPFEETPDQIKAIEDALDDMESGRVMDRLICGDVGFGKTEVAMRAAFQVVMNGKQVAVLVPTTILAFQHEQSFKERLKGTPIEVDSISRFRNTKEQKEIKARAKEGKVDILIGTHRILSRDIDFKDLGLVIVDEEHRFGVEHKEKLKALKVNTHVMTLTATPIPRTLHMSLSGMREISIMTTPPIDRLPIRTYVSKFDENLIKRAIEVELSRGGQVFFLHNRVQSIFEIARKIEELVPQAKVSVGHGQMSERELEKTMLAFYEKKSNVLVCTTIIEAGLDIPSANTIIINRADTFGLAQLYQLRGRVGRGEQRAYAYLLVSSTGRMTEDSKKRLEVIQRFVELGSGFNIASHDLEIRGGGNLLGPQQSGHIAAVGFDLYMELLEEAIAEIRGKEKSSIEQKRDPEIKAPFPAFLDEKFIPDVHQRLSFYRRLSTSSNEEELEKIEEELRDRFGAFPEETQNLMWIIRLKHSLKKIGVDLMTVGKGKISFVPSKDSSLDPTRAISLVSEMPNKIQLLPDSKIVFRTPTDSLKGIYFETESFLAKLVNPS